ncbi:MAG: transcriptional repressor LexA [Tissierellia bacterium]|nr:transcriptional repressor LexA [Tissierellia bacterium]
MSTLNKRQQDIYEYLLHFKNENQYCPSVREICHALEIKSTSTVHKDLNKLEDLGYIRKTNNHSRAIEIIVKEESTSKEKENNIFDIPKEDTIDIPIVGRVAAGEPIFAEENIEFTFPIPAYYANKGDLFMLKVKGESMIEAGILDGDLVLVRKQNYCDNGDTVVALIEDGATVKTFRKENGVVKLIPQNSSMSPIIPDYCDILGKVIALFRENI